MKLFKKDYRRKTPEIEALLEKHQSISKDITLPSGIKIERFSLAHTSDDFTPEFRRYKSLFPNHILLDEDLCDKEINIPKFEEFCNLIDDTKKKERDVLQFIRENEAYFIIASILRQYDFGHHERYIFKEFPLGTSYKVDFLIIGSGSGGMQLIFVEMEEIYGRIIRKDGSLGDSFNKGLRQIDDWKSWLDSNFSSLREVFLKSKGETENSIPMELMAYDSSIIHYVVVAGQRENFKEKTYKIRRKKKSDSNVLLLHYDNLLDYSKKMLESGVF